MKKPNYTQISNQFIEVMSTYTGETIKVFLAISRKTIGWHKECDRISYSQLQKLTGLSVNCIKKSIKILINDQWITQNSTKFGYNYDLNMEDKGVSPGDTPLSCHDTPLSPGDTTKETNNKETNNKKKKEKEKASAVASAKGSAIAETSLAPQAPLALSQPNLGLNIVNKNNPGIDPQNLPDGLELFYKMRVQSQRQRDEVINGLIQIYPIDLLKHALQNIEGKAYFTPAYLYNAIDNILEEAPAMYSNVSSKVKSFCLKFFKRESDAVNVSEFYRKLSQKHNKKLVAKGSEGKKFSERKIDNIKTLVETYGETMYLSAIEKLSAEEKEGRLKSYTLDYVTNRLKYEFESGTKKKTKYSKKSSQEPIEKPTQTYVIPTQYEKRENFYTGKDAPCNWLFICNCGEVINRWAKACPKCTAQFEWDKITFVDTVA